MSFFNSSTRTPARNVLRSNATARFLLFFLAISCWTRDVIALGVQITHPPGGATLPAGAYNVTWEDGGGTVGMADLTTYTLDLIVGGNLGSTDSRSVQTLVQNGRVADGVAAVNISSDTAQSIQNGFYLQMTSNASDGRSVVNYSGRFTLILMTGQTPAVYVQGAGAFVGANNVPPAQLNSQVVLPSPTASSGSTSPSSSTSSAVSTDSTSTDADEGGDGSGLDTSGVIGVAVGGIFVGFALVALGWWFWRMRKRHHRRRKHEHTRSINGFTDGKAELPAHSANSSVASTPVAGNSTLGFAGAQIQPIHEIDTPVKAAEVEGSVIIHELEGDFMGWEMAARKSRHLSYDPTR